MEDKGDILMAAYMSGFYDGKKLLSSSRPLADVRELKDCPFCGGEGSVREWMHPSFRMYFVKCKGCAAEGPWGKNRATAVNLWNMRAHVG